MTQQFEHDYLGYNGTRSRCNVKIYSDDGEHFILFENLGIGTSVTNMSELLASQIAQKMKFNPEDCRFFETYNEYDNETLDEVEYSWYYNNQTKMQEAKNPCWKTGEEFRKYFFK